MTVEPWQSAIIEMRNDIKDMKADGKVDSKRLSEWHTDETKLLTDIKGGVNGVNTFAAKIILVCVAALVILAGAEKALRFLGVG